MIRWGGGGVVVAEVNVNLLWGEGVAGRAEGFLDRDILEKHLLTKTRFCSATVFNPILVLSTLSALVPFSNSLYC